VERILSKMLPGGKFRDVSPIRSRAMGAIHGRGNRTTEVRLRLILVRAGLKGWVMHPSSIDGCPDFFFKKERLAIFVDGCFWHGCPTCGHFPKSNAKFWEAKIKRNRRRDINTTRRLRSRSIRVLRIWEHELTRLDGFLPKLLKGLSQS
jgi:DNA mismatch endonuclease (patch repair protein)